MELGFGRWAAKSCPSPPATTFGSLWIISQSGCFSAGMNHLLLLSPTSRWDTNMTFNKGQNGQTRRPHFLVLSCSLSSFNAAVVLQHKGSMQDSLRISDDADLKFFLPRCCEIITSGSFWSSILLTSNIFCQYLLGLFEESKRPDARQVHENKERLISLRPCSRQRGHQGASPASLRPNRTNVGWNDLYQPTVGGSPSVFS